MKTVKTNNYSQAVKEVEKLDKEQVSRVKEEIKHADRRHIHIVAVSILDRPGEATNKVVINTLIVNEDKLKKLEKNFRFLGYSKLIILHDGTKIEEEVIPTLHIHDKQSIEAKVKAQLEEKHKAEMDELRQQYEAQAIEKASGKVEGTGADEIPNPTDCDTVEEMQLFAKENGVDLTDLRKKDEIKAQLLTWYDRKIQQSIK